MFKIKTFIYMPVLLIGIFQSSCSINKSKIGSWSKKDKKQFENYIKKEDEKGHMSAFSKKQEFIDCLFNKFENTYASFSVAMENRNGEEEMAFCFNEIYGVKSSKKGAWNEEDQNRFDSEMESIKSEINQLGEYKEAFLNCYFEKIQSTFNSFEEAFNSSSKCQQLATQCANEVIK